MKRQDATNKMICDSIFKCSNAEKWTLMSNSSSISALYEYPGIGSMKQRWNGSVVYEYDPAEDRNRRKKNEPDNENELDNRIHAFSTLNYSVADELVRDVNEGIKRRKQKKKKRNRKRSTNEMVKVE